jgi:hypothetical protein
MKDTPNFKTWDHDELSDWAETAYLSIQANQAEMQELRLMISSIVEEMQQVRNTLVSIVDPL